MATQQEIEIVAKAIAKARGGSLMWGTWVEPARAAIAALDSARVEGLKAYTDHRAAKGFGSLDDGPDSPAR